jgi:uncharacterized repeat protein (TIGR04076 family)
MEPNDRVLRIIQRKLSYTHEQLDQFKLNPRNIEVLSKSNELQNIVLVLTVVESHGCNSQHKVGDKIFFDGAGNLLTKYSPPRVCSYALNNAFLMIFAANEFIYSGLSPLSLKFKRCACFDTGVSCGGLGQIVMELSTISLDELNKAYDEK